MPVQPATRVNSSRQPSQALAAVRQQLTHSLFFWGGLSGGPPTLSISRPSVGGRSARQLGARARPGRESPRREIEALKSLGNLRRCPVYAPLVVWRPIPLAPGPPLTGCLIGTTDRAVLLVGNMAYSRAVTLLCGFPVTGALLRAVCGCGCPRATGAMFYRLVKPPAKHWILLCC